MLVELKDVEVFIEPQDILTQALEEGDLAIDRVIGDCISEEGVEALLDAVDNDDILDYVERYKLDDEQYNYSKVVNIIKNFNQQEQALILWQILKCEG